VNRPLVSIHIIAYNQERFIEETLLSALEQNYDPLEVIVADDGSTDRTPDIIRALAVRYPERLVPLLGGPNVGITRNSNRGLWGCKGEYIAFQGGDDVLLPGKIERQVAWLEENPARVLCGHDVAWIDGDGHPLGVNGSTFRPLTTGRGASMILRHGPPFAATAVMVRRVRIPVYGFDERMPFVSDWKLWLDILGRDGEYGYVDGVWANYRRHSANITSKHSRPIMRDLLRTPLVATLGSRGCYPWDAALWYALALRKALLRKVAPLAVGREA